MLYTLICRGWKGYGWHLIRPFLPSPHPHNFCIPLQYPFSTTLWWCNSPAAILTDPISQLSCPWMERGPSDGCPAHTKGREWQVKSLCDHSVITQLRYDTYFKAVCLRFSGPHFGSGPCTINSNTLGAQWIYCTCKDNLSACSGSPGIPNQMANVLKNEISERRRK